MDMRVFSLFLHTDIRRRFFVLWPTVNVDTLSIAPNWTPLIGASHLD